MSRKWLLRQIEIYVVIIGMTEIWRVVSATTTAQDIIADTLECILLVVIMMLCLFTEFRLRQKT